MAENQKPTLTVKGVMADLQEGLTREQIGEKYGLNKTDVTNLFKNPKLKGRKTFKPRKELGFELVDDAPDVAPTNFKPRGPRKAKAEGAAEQTAASSTVEETPVVSADAANTPATGTETPQAEAPAKEGTKVDTKKGMW